MTYSFESGIAPPEPDGQLAYWFIFSKYQLLVRDDEMGIRIPLLYSPDDLPLTLLHQQYLGVLNRNGRAVHCFSGEVDMNVPAPEKMSFLGLRSLFNELDDYMMALAGRAVQIVDWDRTHQFCGQCGSRVNQVAHERAKKCPQCGYTSYPRISPAIIVSVERNDIAGNELLLARNHRFPRGFYSVLAGFVEPGESLEECVRREVSEEVGIEIDSIEYFGSQSWPFPNSLMVAFTAQYVSGALSLEEEELADAGWFAAASLPSIPPKPSIARRLIDAFVERNSRRE